MGKNQYVSTDVLRKICAVLDCTFNDIVEIAEDKNQRQSNAWLFLKVLTGSLNIALSTSRLDCSTHRKEQANAAI